MEDTIENSIECYTYNCQDNNYTEFINEVFCHSEKNSDIHTYVFQDAKEYLVQLEKCSIGQDGKYIEVELNSREKKVIIRDNLNHADIQENIQNVGNYGSKTEYGPVLGWNRICLE